MTWARFARPDPAFVYTSAALKKAWPRLHAGDAEAWPKDAGVLEAWIAFHAGEFETAARQGRAAGLPGYAVANKASCVHAVYLERHAQHKHARLLEVAERCEQQQAQQPENAAGFYWHAYALGRYSQDISILKALAQGIGGKVKTSLDATLALAPRHADAHIALGVYHAEIIDKVGALVGALTYGARADAAIAHFKKALELNAGSAIARVEYARALLMLDRRANAAAAAALYRQAASLAPHDAMERLDIERATQELTG